MRPTLLAWTVLNLVLSGFLGLAFLVQQRDGAPPPTAPPVETVVVPTLPAAEVLILPPQAADQPLRLRLEVPFAGAQAGAEAPAGLIRCQPPLEGRLWFNGAREVCFLPDGEWPAATAVLALVDPEARSADGRRLGSHSLRFVPRPLAVTAVQLGNEDDPAQGRRRLRLHFNHPVATETLRRCLRTPGWTLAPESGMTPFATVSVGNPGPSADQRSFALDLIPDTPDPAAIDLILAADLTSTAGSIPLGEDLHRRFDLREEAVLSGITASAEGIFLHCDKALALPEAGLLATTPALDLRPEVRSGGLFLVGAIPAGSLVRIQAPTGFPGRGRHRLAAPLDDVLRVPDAEAQISLPKTGTVLSRRALPLIDLTTINVDRLRLGLRRVHDHNLVRFAESRWHVPDSICTPWRHHDQAVGGTRNQEATTTIDLAELWGGDLPAGWYELEVANADPDHRGWPRRLVIQSSDIACLLRRDGAQAAVATWSLAEGTPIADAGILLLSDRGERLATARSDGDGIARLDLPGVADHQVPRVVVVRQGDDVVAIDLDRFRMDLAGNRLDGESDADDGLYAWAWCERGLVRPGEALRCAAILRDAAGRPPLGQEVQVDLVDPGGRVAWTRRDRVGEDGLLTCEHEPDLGVTGLWRWRIRSTLGRILAETWQRSEAFVADRIEADFAFAEAISVGEPRLQARIRLTTGEDLPGARIDATVRLHDAVWTPPGREAYRFDARGEDDGQDLGRTLQQRLVTGADGAATWTAKLPPLSGRQVIRAVAQGEAHDPGGRVLPLAAETIITLRPVLIGVRADESDGRLTCEAIACASDGSDATMPPGLRLRLERRRHRWDLREQGGRMRWTTQVEREVLDGDLRPGVDVPDRNGGWLVVVAAVDDVDVAEASVGAAPLPGDTLRLRVVPPAAGSLTEVEISSPLAGDLLLSVEGGGIHTLTRHSLTAGQTRIALQLPEIRDRPNLHVVALVHGAQRHRGDGPLWLTAAAPLSLDRPERRLPISLTVPETVPPDGVLPLRLQAPGARRALVCAVDEAVLARTRHAVPDPAARFARPRRLQGVGATSLASLMEPPRWPTEPGGDGDLDEAILLALGRRSADLDHLGSLALWRVVDLDASGSGSVDLPLADFEGRVRVIALAATATATGAARADCRVRGTLGLRLHLPRVLCPGDTCTAMATISLRDCAGVVRLDLDGGEALTIAAVAARPALAGDILAVPLALTARQADGQAAIAATLTVDGTDGRTQQRRIVARLPVRPAGRFVEDRRVLSLQAGINAWTDREGWLEPPRLTMRLPSDPRAALRPAFDELAAYPYGCGEQIASQVLVLAALSGLAEDGRAAGILPHGVRALGILAADGGWRLWPNDRTAHPVVSVHALRAVLTAERAGAALDPDERKAWLDAAEARLRRETRTILRCHLVAVLAEGGRRIGPWIDVLLPDSDREGRCWLAIAAVANGEADRAAGILADLGEAGAPTSDDGLWRSPLRADAIEVLARVQADPASPRLALLGERLAAAVARPRRRSTYELAHILPALDAWSRLRAATPMPRVAVDGHDLDPGSSLDLLGDHDLSIVASTAGSLLVTASGWRGDAGLPTAPGLELKRRWISAHHSGTAGLRRGERAWCLLTLTTDRPLPSGILSDLLPAGLEIDDAVPAPSVPGLAPLTAPRHVQAGDDRMLLVLDDLPAGSTTVAYAVRAVTSGTFHAGAPVFEAFAEPDLVSVGVVDRLEVSDDRP